MKRKIRTRIFRAFFTVLAISMVVAAFVAGVTIFGIRNDALESNAQIGQSAAQSSEQALTDQAVLDMQQLSQAKADLIDANLNETADQLREIAYCIDDIYQEPEQFEEIQYPYVKDVPSGERSLHWVLASPEVSLAEVEHEMYLMGNLQWLYGAIMDVNPNISTIYYAAESGMAVGYDSATGQKDYYYEGRHTEWYTKAKETGGLVVSDTYQDVYGRGLTISMAMPCYGAQDVFVGVVGLDILIEELNEEIQHTTVLDGGYAMLLGEGRKVISAPGLTEENRNNAAAFLGSNATDISAEMAEKPNGAALTEIDGQAYYAVWASVSIADWDYVLMAPREGIVAPAEQSKAEIEALSAESAAEMDDKMVTGNIVFLALLVLTVGIVAWLTMRISRNITKPISTLDEEVKLVGSGDFDYVSNIHTGDEIEGLSHSFEHMTRELKAYMENLAKVTADKERIATELNVAKQIQASMLPCIFPPFPEMDTFDIYATMQPAKEVGGDFYDFFLLDEDHLAVVVADVSGKGVPAALFMVIAKTLIKNHMQNGEAPQDAFMSVNAQLCENNDMDMFVTAFMGVLEISTGKFTFVNAGHNPPLIRRIGGTYEFLKTRAGFVLAGMEGVRYKEQETELRKGDRLYLYTDGVTEAVNKEEELFGENRLVRVLNETDDMPLMEMLPYVKSEIDAFAEGAEQFDDITMLVVEVK